MHSSRSDNILNIGCLGITMLLSQHAEVMWISDVQFWARSLLVFDKTHLSSWFCKEICLFCISSWAKQMYTMWMYVVCKVTIITIRFLCSTHIS